ncbi:MAG: enoyl-CoA hydratase [Vulcanimicrobiaceae bacterium]
MMQSNSETPFVERSDRDDGIAILTMNRPQRRNALSLAMMRALIEAFQDINAAGEVRAVILRGAGPAFCAGHDLSELIGRDVNAYRRIFTTCVELMECIQRIAPPVIAEVAGMATAAGCQLVATCDLAVAASSAHFATPGVKIGLFCSTPMVALTRAIGRKRAMELLLTGEPIDAATAAQWGLINRVVAPERLSEETLALAHRITGASADIVALGKSAFYAQVDLDQPKAYAYAQEVMSLNAFDADAQEGMSAFLAKRKPHWKFTDSSRSASTRYE